MNCEDLAIVECWHQPDWEWKRASELEIEFGEESE